MKKTLSLGLAVGLVSLVAASAFAASAVRNLPAPGYTGQKNTGAAGIVGSSHDMSNVANTGAGTASNITAGYSTGAADPQKRICVYCHHPHNAYSATSVGAKGGRDGATAAVGDYSPLWNRVTPAATAFVGYDNGIMMAGRDGVSDKQHALNAEAHGGTSISGVSLLCMSCHDGVTAMNAYSVNTGSDNLGHTNTDPNDPSWKNNHNITSTAGFKGDMNNHHPMGFSYSGVRAVDNEIANEDTTIMVPSPSDIGSTTITGTVKIADLLYGTNATMECVTCHDVHNTANQQGAERFLWRSNTESNFCLTCHLK